MPIRFEKPERVRQVPPHIDPEQFKRDLEVLRNKARNAGQPTSSLIPRSRPESMPMMVIPLSTGPWIIPRTMSKRRCGLFRAACFSV
jgi:hypothetical protein